MLAVNGESKVIGGHFNFAVRNDSSGMKSRLAYAMSTGAPFNTYLIDEVAFVGDAAFRQKSEAILNDRLKESGAIIVSHFLPLLERLCISYVVLENDRFFYYPWVPKSD